MVRLGVRPDTIEAATGHLREIYETLVIDVADSGDGTERVTAYLDGKPTLIAPLAEVLEVLALTEEELVPRDGRER